MKRKSASPSRDARTGKWRLHFSYDGKLYRRYYIDNKRDAQLLQDEVNHRMRRLKLGLESVPQSTTLEDYIFDGAVEAQEKHYRKPQTLSALLDLAEARLIPPIKAKSTCSIQKIHIGHLRKYIDFSGIDPILENITPGFFDGYKQIRYAKNIKTDTVKKELSTFQGIFAQAIADGLLQKNVVSEVRRDKSQVPCDRFRTHAEILELQETGHYTAEELRELRRYQYLKVDEIEELIDLAEGKWLQPILIAFAYTGVRRGELLKLEWSDIDFEARSLYVRSKKQSRAVASTQRRIPIHDRLLPVLEAQRLRTGKGRWVFANRTGGQLYVGTILVAFRRLIKSTEFEGIGFHLFRHSLASNLAARGVEQHYIDSILGHQTEAMRRRYQHLFPDRIEAALRMISIL